MTEVFGYSSKARPALVKLITHFSKESEFNSPERMRKYFGQLAALYHEFSQHRSINHFHNMYGQIEKHFDKFTGTKREKIRKVLNFANLIHNNTRPNQYQGGIKDELLNSKYIDKFHFNIMEATIESYVLLKDSIKELTRDQQEAKYNHSDRGGWEDEDGEWHKYDKKYLTATPTELLIDGISSISEKLAGQVAPEDLEALVPSDLNEIIAPLVQAKTLDEYIELVGSGGSSLKGEGIEAAKRIISRLKYGLSLYAQMSSVIEYYEHAEKKDPKIFSANLDKGNWRFRVLKDLDPYHFQVGADTSCCQVIGGAGEMAAVDSFINKYAGVLLLEAKMDGEWELLAQSYFHYVPEGELIILDNIEAGIWDDRKHRTMVAEQTGYTFQDMYAILGKHLEDQGIKDVLVGKEYTVIIDGDHFKTDSREEDPRRMLTSDIYDDEYSDYDPEDSMSLLGPSFEISQQEARARKIKLDIIKSARIPVSIVRYVLPAKISNDDVIIKIKALRKYLIDNGMTKEARTISRMFK